MIKKCFGLLYLFLITTYCGTPPANSILNSITSINYEVEQLLSPEDLSFAKKVLETVAILKTPDNPIWSSYQLKDQAILLNRIDHYSCLINHPKAPTDYNLLFSQKDITMNCSTKSSQDTSSFNPIEIEGVATMIFQFNNTEMSFGLLDSQTDNLSFLFHELFHQHQNSMELNANGAMTYEAFLEEENVMLILLEARILNNYITGNLSANNAAFDIIALRNYRQTLATNSVEYDNAWESIEGTPAFVEIQLLKALDYSAIDINKYLTNHAKEISEYFLPLNNSQLERSFEFISRDKAYALGSALCRIILEKRAVDDDFYTQTPFELMKQVYAFDDVSLKNRSIDLITSLTTSPNLIPLKNIARQIVTAQHSKINRVYPLFDAHEARILLPNFHHFSASEVVTLPNSEWLAKYTYYNADETSTFSVEQEAPDLMGMDISTTNGNSAFLQHLSTNSIINIDDGAQNLILNEFIAANTNVVFTSKIIISGPGQFKLTISGQGEIIILPHNTLVLKPAASSSFFANMEKVAEAFKDEVSLEEIKNTNVTWAY